MALLLPAFMSRLAEPASDLRSSLGAAAWRMFLEDPATGAGPGMYVVERARLTQPAEVDFYVAHAHNLFAQTLAEFGLVGVAATILIVLTVGRLVHRGIMSDDPLARRLGWASLAGLAYLAAHQLFDFYLNMPAIGLALALSVSRLDALVTSRSDTPVAAAPVTRGRWPVSHWVPIVAIAVATATAIIPLARLESVALTARKATAAANARDWPTVLTSARSTVDAQPDMPPYLFTLGLAAANAGHADEARDAFRRSAEMDDYPTSWLNVARLQLEAGDDAAARDAVARAMRLGYQQPQVSVGAALILTEVGDPGAAASAVANALVSAPGLAGDPFWTSSPGLQAAWAIGVSQALDWLPPEQAYELALEAGQPDLARQLVRSLADPARSTSESVVDAWMGDASAFARLRARTRANPFDGHLVALCHRVANRATEELALDAAAWDCGGAGYAYSPIVIEVGDPPTSREWLPGPNATWHFQGAYERFVPFDELVPGLPHLRAR
jgi:tetratricopeptide (TPR) repeat protein